MWEGLTRGEDVLEVGGRGIGVAAKDGQQVGGDELHGGGARKLASVLSGG